MAPNHSFLLTDASGEPVSRTYQYRKVMKPMLERKRRARINRCLDELKELMTGALQTEGENVAKLEKADILELTVRHLHNLRRQGQPTTRSDQSYADRFKAGFRHCAAEVTHFLNGVDQHTSVHVLKHLNLCIKQLDALPHHQLGPPSVVKCADGSPPPPAAPQPLLPQPQPPQLQHPQQQLPSQLAAQTPPTIPIPPTSAIQQPQLYTSGFWTQKPIPPRSASNNFNNHLHNPQQQQQQQLFISRNHRSESRLDDDCDHIDVDEELEHYDDDDSNESMTRIHTPPLSPKIEVVDDAPVWRPW